LNTEVIIVGAGLAGILASLELKGRGIEVIVVDSSLPQANGEIGGFAKFSGAKFSLPPAGMGLLNVAKDTKVLWNAIKKAADYLGISLENYETSSDFTIENSIENLRKYESIVFSPNEIDQMLLGLEHKLKIEKIKLIKGKCNKIRKTKEGFSIKLESNSTSLEIKCNSVFYAGGRLGSGLLENLGAEQTNRKGLDVGVRIEFEDVEHLAKLRSHGPDAKIINNNSRTFCLNVPGEIYRYPYAHISVPGGVVSEGTRSNVGILYRNSEKKELLEGIMKRSMQLTCSELEKPYIATGDMLGSSKEILNFIFGHDITFKLEEFGEYLSDSGLINWEDKHFVHLPLIDWHWPTFAIENSFKTNISGLFCLGDSSGHARGLLQAAVSGILAVREY
jgi:uncharacterized FAD-dependent dehydrogenase